MFGSLVFLDNHVYNMTSREMQRLEGCSQGGVSLVQPKNQPEDGLLLSRCCEEGECRAELMTLKRVNEDTSVLFWITLSFFGVLFVAVR